MTTWSAAGVGEWRTLAIVRLSWTLLVLGPRVGHQTTAGASVGSAVHAFCESDRSDATPAWTTPSAATRHKPRRQTLSALAKVDHAQAHNRAQTHETHDSRVSLDTATPTGGAAEGPECLRGEAQ